MYDPQRIRIARAVADEMARQQEMTFVEEANHKTFKVDIGGYTITTITVSKGVQVSHELHPKVVQRDVEDDEKLVRYAERAFDNAFLRVMKDEVNVRQA